MQGGSQPPGPTKPKAKPEGLVMGDRRVEGNLPGIRHFSPEDYSVRWAAVLRAPIRHHACCSGGERALPYTCWESGKVDRLIVNG